MSFCRSITTRLSTQLPKTYSSRSIRLLSTTSARMGKDSRMPTGPPKHEMVYFPKLTSEVRSFGQFRKVMHTGLYSQVVSMEIPVGGDIGDEVHTVDQVLIFTSGEGKATVAGKDQVCTIITSCSMSWYADSNTGCQSNGRCCRPSRHPAPIHQHFQDTATRVSDDLQSS